MAKVRFGRHFGHLFDSFCPFRAHFRSNLAQLEEQKAVEKAELEKLAKLGAGAGAGGVDESVEMGTIPVEPEL